LADLRQHRPARGPLSRFLRGWRHTRPGPIAYPGRDRLPVLCPSQGVVCEPFSPGDASPRAGFLAKLAGRAGAWMTQAMPIKTKRWNDPRKPSDKFRLLICRYRPRALPKAEETWNAWWPELGQSKKLHADFYGKNGPPIDWEEYRRRYLEE